MALNINHPMLTKIGVTLDGAYIRIQPTLDISGSKLHVEIHYYMSKSAYLNGFETISVSDFVSVERNNEVDVLLDAHNAVVSRIAESGILLDNIEIVDM